MLKPFCKDCQEIVPARVLDVENVLKYWCRQCDAPITTFVKEFEEEPASAHMVTRRSGFNQITANQRRRFSR
jgi:hypothetical protein